MPALVKPQLDLDFGVVDGELGATAHGGNLGHAAHAQQSRLTDSSPLAGPACRRGYILSRHVHLRQRSGAATAALLKSATSSIRRSRPNTEYNNAPVGRAYSKLSQVFAHSGQ